MQQEKLPPFGAELRKRRGNAGLSQEKLAEKLGISREAVSQIERGDIKRPSNEILEKIEDTLGLSRLLAYQLIGSIADVNQSDPSLLLQQIAALPSREARLQAWKELPDSLRQAITILMQDVLGEAASQLSGLGSR